MCCFVFVHILSLIVNYFAFLQFAGTLPQFSSFFASAGSGPGVDASAGSFREISGLVFREQFLKQPGTCESLFCWC